MNSTKFTKETIKMLDAVKDEYGENCLVTIRVDDYGVVITSVITRKIVFHSDTLAEFTHKFHKGE